MVRVSRLDPKKTALRAAAAAAISTMFFAGAPASAQSGCDRILSQCQPVMTDACRSRDNGDQQCTDLLQDWLKCGDKVVVDCRPGLDRPASGATPLLGTEWSGTGLEGKPYVFRFHDQGILNYTTPTGTWETGRWIHSNGELMISMNEGYAIYIGHVDGDVMTGVADNTTGLSWSWRLLRDEPSSSGGGGVWHKN